MIKYDKMMKLLAEHGYNTTRIRREHIVGEGTLTAIRNGTGGIDHRTIDKLCRILQCQPGDLMEYVEDERMTSLGRSSTEFEPAPGELCPVDCKRRGERIDDEGTHPWCFEHGVEITGNTKCAACLNLLKEEL